MAARQRHEDESYEDYKLALKAEEHSVVSKLKGKWVWLSKAYMPLVFPGTSAIIPGEFVVNPRQSMGTYRRP